MQKIQHTRFAMLLGAAFSLAVGCAPAGGDSSDGGPDASSDGGDTTNPDAGIPMGDGGSGGTITGGENCGSAPTITPGTISGSTAGAADDYQGSCDAWSEGPGPDVVYQFTLTEESGVSLSVSGYDAILYLYAGSACTEELRCSDAIGAEETLTLASLAAGDYFVVVDTFIGDVEEGRQVDGAAFTLTFETTAPYCEADRFDADPEDNNNTPQDAIGTGFRNIDTTDLDPEEPGNQGITLNLCEGDVDYFAIGHIGGALNVTVSGVAGDAAPSFELLSATATLEDGTITGYSAGGPINNNSEQARGAYLLKVTADSLPETGLGYSFAITHGCEGDNGDSFLLELDDGSVANAPTVYTATEEPIAKSVCGEDIDSFVLQNLSEGDVTVTLNATTALTVQVFNVSEDDEGERNATAMASSAYTLETQGTNTVLTLTNAPVGLFMVSISTAQTVQVDYTASISFAGIEGPPANDTCATAATLVPSNDPTPIFGRTLGGTHTLAGPTLTEDGDEFSCNGDGEVPAESEVSPAPEVFYYLSLPEPKNLDIFVDGSATEFGAALYVLSLPDQMCPTDVSSLTPVSVNDEPICEMGVRVRARIPQASGDYLVVVDGQYINFALFGIEFSTSGAFEIRAKTYDGDFPAPQACQDASAIDVPTAGNPTTFTVNYAGAGEELSSDDCGGRGAERVYTFTPSADVQLKITTGGGEDDVDTVAYLMEGECSESNAAATNETDGTCNDDGDDVENFGSQFTVSVTAGTTYYLVVDAYSSNTGTAGVTIEVVN